MTSTQDNKTHSQWSFTLDLKKILWNKIIVKYIYMFKLWYCLWHTAVGFCLFWKMLSIWIVLRSDFLYRFTNTDPYGNFWDHILCNIKCLACIVNFIFYMFRRFWYSSIINLQKFNPMKINRSTVNCFFKLLNER